MHPGLLQINALAIEQLLTKIRRKIPTTISIVNAKKPCVTVAPIITTSNIYPFYRLVVQKTRQTFTMPAAQIPAPAGAMKLSLPVVSAASTGFTGVRLVKI
jgi:hypothetical protein